MCPTLPLLCQLIASIFFFATDMSETLNSSLREPSSDDGQHTPPRRNVRGKGKGGASGKYCTIGPQKRQEKLPGHPLSVRPTDLGIEVLWCDVCGCPVSHMAKSSVSGHLEFKKHQAAVQTMKNSDKLRAKHCLEAEGETLPQKTALRQLDLQFVVASRNDKSTTKTAFYLCFMLHFLHFPCIFPHFFWMLATAFSP